MYWKNIIEWIKLSPKYLLPISLICGFLIFSNQPVLDLFGVNDLVINFRPVIGIVFLVSSTLVISDLIIKVFNHLKKYIKVRHDYKHLKDRLNKMTPDEKDIILSYLYNNSRTLYLPITNGIVNELVAFGIIYQASKVGEVESWAFNIQPWVWNYLEKHKNEIFTKEELEEIPNATLLNSRRYRRS